MIAVEFNSGESFIHRLDPRLKIIILVMLASVTAAGSNIFMLAQALGFSVLLILAAGLDIREVFRRLTLMNVFIAGIWLLVPFTYPGEVLWEIGPLQMTAAGLAYALRITLRSNAVMLAVFALLSTSSVSSLMQSFAYFHLPKKLIYLFFFVYRYIFVLGDEFGSLQNSIRARGFKSTTSLHSYRIYAFLIGMLLVRSYERSTRVYRAMLARGFKGEFYVKDELKISSNDLLAFSFSILFLGLFFVLEYIVAI